MKIIIIIITIFCVAPWVCFGLKCKFNDKTPGYWPEIVNCQPDEHYCAAANCTTFLWDLIHFTSWGCFNSTDSQKCSELFEAKSIGNEKTTCDPCVIGEKDVDLANENFTKVLRCKRGEEVEGSNDNYNEIVECNDGSHFCVAASCIYLNSGNNGFPPPNVKKAVYNVTKWGCSNNGMHPYSPHRDLLCDEPRFIGEKDVDLANINYTGIFPTAHEYKLAGLDPLTKMTRPMANAGNRIESAFINLVLVMLTFVMAILCRF
uniref:Secreted protein n=1 Tax=Globodera pallida TaxID=36090 RepID=A0A183CK82_GLOPA